MFNISGILEPWEAAFHPALSRLPDNASFLGVKHVAAVSEP